MVIGSTNNNKVLWDQNNNSITIDNTNITIANVSTYEKAIETCERNLKNFKPIETLSAEYIDYMDAYRIYNPQKPQWTMCYADTLKEVKEIAKRENKELNIVISL